MDQHERAPPLAMKAVPEEPEHRRLHHAWEHLERAADSLPPGHPAELHLRRALAAAEAHWRSPSAPEDR
jgi:phosphoribosyl 1,2-cyclic phosphodiesterase